MTPETIFSIANAAVLPGWLLLVVFPNNKFTTTWIAGRALPLLLAVSYLAVMITHGRDAQGSFQTLDGVIQLFSSRWLVLAGWMHYLAFDLFIGAWETRDAARHKISRWLLLPCQFLTFMLGPIGLLTYFLIRGALAQWGSARGSATPTA